MEDRLTLAMLHIVFGTLTSQLHALGLCQQGPVVAVGVVCGNLLLNMSMQLRGFDSIVTGVYGVSFVAYSTMTLMTSVVFIDMVQLTHKDLAYYLIAWSWVNVLFFVRSVSVHDYSQAVYFLCIAIGSVLEILQAACGLPMYHVNNAIVLFALLIPIARVSIGVLRVKDDGHTSRESESIDIMRQVSDATGLSICAA